MLPIKVMTDSKRFSIVFDGKEFLVCSFDIDKRVLQIALPNDGGEVDIVEVNELDPNNNDIELIEIADEEPQEIEATPAYHPGNLIPDLADIGNARTERNLWFRDECISEIIESWERNPVQTTEETAEESRRIALNIFGVDSPHTVMQVAGVRSSLTKGHYDHSHPGASETRERVLRARS